MRAGADRSATQSADKPGAGALLILAALLTLLAAAASAVFRELHWPNVAFNVVTGCLGLYSLTLLTCSRPRAGRITGLLVTATVTLLALLAGPMGGLTVIAMLGWTWLVRCGLFHRSLGGLLGDAGLLLGGVMMAVWAFQMGAGLILALWSFFLVQALLPWVGQRRSNRQPPWPQGDFERARDRAERALRRLYLRPQP